MKELNLTEVEQVSGAISSDTVHGVAVGAAVGLVVAAATVASPVLAFAFAAGSMVSSGVAIDMAWMSGGGYQEFVPDLTRRRG